MLYFCPKNITVNYTHYFLLKILKKDNFNHFINLYKKCTAKPYSFLVINPNKAGIFEGSFFWGGVGWGRQSDPPPPFPSSLLKKNLFNTNIA